MASRAPVDPSDLTPVPYVIGRLTDVLEQANDLPTLPTIVLQLHRVLDDERAGPVQVAAIIEQDPSLTARLLRAANSAAFSRGGNTIGSVSAAVARMGVNQVRAVCIVLAVVKAFGGGGRRLDHQRFWLHAATVAATAQRLWERFDDRSGIKAEDAYVAGLLHDVGLLVLEQYFPDDLAEVSAALVEHPGPLWPLEEERLGLDHGAVGGLLIGRWSLPVFTAEAIANHHHPDQALPEFARLARVIQAAEASAYGAGAGLSEEGLPDAEARALLRALGATDDECDRVLADVPGAVERASHFLG